MIGLPPLIGYLAAGFSIAASADYLGLSVDSTSALQHIAHLGVLLLFTVGLKLKVKSLVRPEVMGGGLLHFFISTAVFTPAFFLFLEVNWYTAVMLSIALSFSSTVLGRQSPRRQTGTARFPRPRRHRYFGGTRLNRFMCDEYCQRANTFDVGTSGIWHTLAAPADLSLG